MTKCKYCGYEPKTWIGSLKNKFQGHDCPVNDVFKLAKNNDKAN